MNKRPLVVIVGPTASGKSALAIELAQKYNGEIVCADSRTVYKGLDIGTAKPSKTERRAVRHHLLDVVSPDEPFTAADFKRLSLKAIEDVYARGKLPIMVGGSGLYIDAVLFEYSFSDDGARNQTNPRHASASARHTKSDMRPNTLVIGLLVEREDLQQRIIQRVESMIDLGLVDEVEKLITDYPYSKALDSTGYKAFREYITESKSLQKAKQEFVTNDYQLSRRQMTWFKRNKSIQWVNDPSQADDLVTTFLNKKQ